MRKNRVAALLGLVLALSVASLVVSAATKTATIRVEGMHCKMCSASVAKALEATEGVEKVEVSQDGGRENLRRHPHQSQAIRSPLAWRLICG